MYKRKRKNMEASTPVSNRRETVLIDMDDSSPIDKLSQEGTLTSEESFDTIPTSKKKAGISDEIDTMAVTPEKEYSPDTMDRKLALHTIDLVKSAVNNDGLLELREQEAHVLPISENPFKKNDCQRSGRSTVDPVMNWSDGMNGMNNSLNGVGGSDNGTVGMNGMNNPQIGVGRVNNGDDAIDGMNKPLPKGGGIK